MFHDAVDSYRMAKDFAETYLGDKDSITINLQNIYKRASDEIDNQMRRVQEKQNKVELIRNRTRAISNVRTQRVIKNHTLGGNNKRLLASSNAIRQRGHYMGEIQDDLDHYANYIP
jgi:hypothetical protein